MKTKEEIYKIASKLSLEYFTKLAANNNSCFAAVGKEEGEINKQFVIYFYLKNDNSMDIIPSEYDGVKILTKVVGTVQPAQIKKKSKLKKKEIK